LFYNDKMVVLYDYTFFMINVVMKFPQSIIMLHSRLLCVNFFDNHLVKRIGLENLVNCVLKI
jgi:hypothetical protein